MTLKDISNGTVGRSFASVFRIHIFSGYLD